MQRAMATATARLGKAGGGNGDADLAAFNRQQEIYKFLTEKGANEKTARALARRRDVNLEVIRAEYTRIADDPNLKDPVGTLIGYFNSAVWVKCRAKEKGVSKAPP